MHVIFSNFFSLIICWIWYVCVPSLFWLLQLLRSCAPDIEMANCQYGNANEKFVKEWGPIFVFMKCFLTLLDSSPVLKMKSIINFLVDGFLKATYLLYNTLPASSPCLMEFHKCCQSRIFYTKTTLCHLSKHKSRRCFVDKKSRQESTRTKSCDIFYRKNP